MKIFCVSILLAAGGLTLPAQTNAPVKSILARAPTRINSDTVDFDLNRRTAIYRGNVRVDDPQMKMTCALLTADLPEAGGHINRIVAETNVVIDFVDDKGQTNHATSDRAIYDFNVKDATTNETVTLTGNAKVESPQGTLTGEPIVWDRVNNRFSAVNETMVFRQNLGSAAKAVNSIVNTNKLPALK